MTFKDAYSRCHVRSCIYRRSKPKTLYAKNHDVDIMLRVPAADRMATDWEEWDPREDPLAPEFNETPA